MYRKIISFLTVLIMLASVMTLAAGAEEKNGVWKAKDDFEGYFGGYTHSSKTWGDGATGEAHTIKNSQDKNTQDYGIGFDSVWTTNKNNFSSGDFSYTQQLRYRPEFQNIAYNNNGANVLVSRKLGFNIDLSKDGYYFVSAIFSTSTSSVNNFRMHNARLYLGNNIYFGSKAVEGKSYLKNGNAYSFITDSLSEYCDSQGLSFPQLSVDGGTNVLVGDAKLNINTHVGAPYVYTLIVKSSENESDEVEFIAYPYSGGSMTSPVSSLKATLDSDEIINHISMSDGSNMTMLIYEIFVEAFSEANGWGNEAASVKDALLKNQNGQLSKALTKKAVLSSLPADSLAAEYLSKLPKETELEAEIENIIEKAQSGAASLDEVKKAFEGIDSVYDDSDVNTYSTTLKDYAVLNRWENEIRPLIASHSLQAGEDIHASELKTIDISYNYTIKSGTYTLSGNNGDVLAVSADINGKNVSVTIKDKLKPNVTYTLIPSDIKDFKGDTAAESISFKTSILPEINVSDGGKYTIPYVISWEDGENAESTAELINKDGDKKTLENGNTITESGTFTINLTTISETETKTRTITVTFEEDFPPVAESLEIKEDSSVKGKLIASFKVTDKNGDEEGNHKIIWYRNEKAVLEDSHEYNLTSEDEDSYITFSVKPCSISPVNPEGEVYMSKKYTAPFRPIASDVKIKENPEANEKIKVSYKYYDENGDNQGATTVEWFYADNKEMKNKISLGVYDVSYELEITESLYNKYIVALVTPQSEIEPKGGNAVFSNVSKAPFNPVAKNVTITGDATEGGTLYATAEFYDENYDVPDENGYSYEWINTATNEIIGTGASYIVPYNFAGINISVRVSVKSEKVPYFSTPVTSNNSVTVSSAYIPGASYGSSSSGGGFSGGSSKYAGSASGSDKKVEAKPSENEKTEISNDFSDMKNHWAKDYVKILKEKNIVSGVGENLYMPDKKVTRAELLAMLYRTKSEPLKKYEGGFSDVLPSDWYADYVASALSSGVISPDEKFRPGDYVLREEAAKMISVFLNLEEKSEEISFSDSENISEWAFEYVSKVYKNGLFKGDENNCFNAKNSLTRAEIAAVIVRALYE